MYAIVLRAAKIVPKLPRWLRQVIAVVVGTLAWGLAPRRRAHVSANVAQVLGPSILRSRIGRVRAQLVVRRIFCHCIQNYLELFALRALTKEQLLATMEFPKGIEYLEQALSYGRGVVLFSAHLGPFECLPALFSALDFQMVIPVENMNDARMLHLMLDLRRRNGIEFVPLDGAKAILPLVTALRRNQIVAIFADRAIAGESVVMDFFGAAARLPRGPVDLSLRTGAPLVGAFSWRTPGGRVTGEFKPLTLALPDDQRDKPEVLQAELLRQIEQAVGKHLDEWVVFEPIWANVGSAGAQPQR